MLAFRIVSTVLLGLSAIWAIFRHGEMFDNEASMTAAIIWSLGWRAFVIVSVWII